MPWREVVHAARLVRAAALEAVGLAAFVKTIGGAGLHVVTPLVPERPWTERLAVAALSTRARPGAPVSVPLAWDELAGARAERYTLRTVPRRLARLRADYWAGYERARRSLARSRLQAVGALAQA